MQSQNRLPTFQQSLRAAVRRRSSTRHKGVGGYVYLVEFLDGFYKIGMTTDPGRRVKKLHGGVPSALTLIHAVPVVDMVWAESYVHGRLASKRVKGEWFKLEPQDVAWFCSLEELREEAI